MSSPANPSIDVIVPVYGGFAQTRRCLESVARALNELAYELVVVDDAGPEPEVGELLDELAAAGRITLLRNPSNLGFVASCNRGMALHPQRDVVLLNSDTEVADHWLDRLHRCASQAEAVATVTPFSNNATICSYPDLDRNNDLPAGLGLAQLDGLFAAQNSGRSLEIPTAVGFCMYIRRPALVAVGGFNEELFGLGYGEENDFCMRARAAGWRHLLCADTFVYHAGGISFGERQAELSAQAQATLRRLHPTYAESVEQFIEADPAAPLRQAVDRARARLGGEQAELVYQEQLARLTTLGGRYRHSQGELARVEAELAQVYTALEEARSLFAESQQRLLTAEQALATAQEFVRQREAELAEAQALAQHLDSELEKLKGHNTEMAEHIQAIHASRLWRYSQFLRKS